MKAIYLTHHFKNPEEISLPCTDRPQPRPKIGECLVKVCSAGINPSDALGALGYFSHARLPRIPGRDFSGIIRDGESHLIGKRVYGTGGAAGLDFDGTHAEFTLIPESAIAEIPSSLSLTQAGAQTLPYVTAYYSLVARANIQPGEKILVIGALGQVGSAAMSICFWKGCHPIALVRNESDIQKANALNWEAYHVPPSHLSFDVIFNTIGNPYWDDLLNLLSRHGRMVIIAAPEGKREANLNLFHLYRKNHHILGINSVDFDYTENARILNALTPGFESGLLVPLPIDPAATFPLTEATKAYQLVFKNISGKRVMLSITDE